MHSHTAHTVSDTKEGYISGHRHQRVPNSGQRDGATDRVYTVPKDNPTEDGTTA